MRHPDMSYSLVEPVVQTNWNGRVQTAEPRKKTLLRERVAVVGIAALLHASAFAAYWVHLEQPAMVINEMSISLADMQVQQPDAMPRPKPEPKPPRVIDPLAAEKLVEHEEVPPAPVDATPPSPVVMDTEPDYKAEYLNNPKPPYPLVARRLGYQGKVILHVEVLAEGRAGQIHLDSSSGHDMLDNAAIQTVRSWHFTPARHLGQPVTQWFLIPINFFLESKSS
jgi:periplasmic protein TonB